MESSGNRANSFFFREALAPPRAVAGALADHISPQNLSAMLFEKNRKLLLREPAICRSVNKAICMNRQTEETEEEFCILHSAFYISQTSPFAPITDARQGRSNPDIS